MATLQGAAGMDATVARLQRAMDELDAAAGYFEALGLHSQAELLDGAQDKAEEVKELLEVVLGRVELENPIPPKRARSLSKARLAKGRAA